METFPNFLPLNHLPLQFVYGILHTFLQLFPDSMLVLLTSNIIVLSKHIFPKDDLDTILYELNPSEAFSDTSTLHSDSVIHWQGFGFPINAKC